VEVRKARLLSLIRRGLDFCPPHHEELPLDTPTLVVCHGLTGGSHESYVRNILAMAVKPKDEGGLGARGIVVNVRPQCSRTKRSTADMLSFEDALVLRSRRPSCTLQVPRST
jgi:predicted alpha/beta-fold hydrolase